jgi:hypothetical protein
MNFNVKIVFLVFVKLTYYLKFKNDLIITFETLHLD